MEKTISEKSAAKQQMREHKKQLLAEARAELAREWNALNDQFEGVYVFRSELNTDDFGGPLRLRKVTVVGAVKKNEQGSYDLQIAWSKCHEKDNFDRKVGNMIALRRAANPDKEFVTDDYFKAKPLVIRNFATDRVKENFIPIATLIVDAFEDVYSFKTRSVIPTKYGFGSLFLNNVAELFYKKNVQDAEFEIVD